MFKSMAYYPRTRRSVYEHLVLTGYASRVITNFWDYIDSHGILQEGAGELLSCSASQIGRYRNQLEVPSLEKYFKMKEILKMPQTRRDINYAYAEVVYTPYEIMERLKRLLKTWKNTVGFSALARILNMREQSIEDAVKYRKDRSPNSYAQVMFWIADEEHRRGYSDALRFYR